MPAWLRQSLDEGRTSFDRRSVGARILASYLNPSIRPYIHLIDGGYSDYFGIRNPLTVARATADFRGQSRLPRRIIAIVVNAKRESEESWGEIDKMSSVSSVFPIIANVQIDRYSVETLELLRSNFQLWQERAKEAGALLDFHIIEVGFAAARDDAERDYLNHVPTALTLPAEDVDHLREAARRILRQSPEFQKLLLELSTPTQSSIR
jgi:NTE family protein